MNVSEHIITTGDLSVNEGFTSDKEGHVFFLNIYQARIRNYSSHIEILLHLHKLPLAELHATKNFSDLLIEHPLIYERRNENTKLRDFIAGICIFEQIGLELKFQGIEIDPSLLQQKSVLREMGYEDQGINDYKKCEGRIIFPY